MTANQSIRLDESTLLPFQARNKPLLPSRTKEGIICPVSGDVIWWTDVSFGFTLK